MRRSISLPTAHPEKAFHGPTWRGTAFFVAPLLIPTLIGKHQPLFQMFIFQPNCSFKQLLSYSKYALTCCVISHIYLLPINSVNTSAQYPRLAIVTHTRESSFRTRLVKRAAWCACRQMILLPFVQLICLTRITHARLQPVRASRVRPVTICTHWRCSCSRTPEGSRGGG